MVPGSNTDFEGKYKSKRMEEARDLQLGRIDETCPYPKNEKSTRVGSPGRGKV